MRTLTVKERIQLHLFDYSRFSEAFEAPLEVTQEAIARAVGIRVHHVNQYVRPLKADGLVEERVSHIKKSRRRRKTYFLTTKGRSQAADLRAHLLREEVPFRDRSGQTQDAPLSRILLEDRRGSSVLELLTELQTLGCVGDVPPAEKAGFVDLTQEAPSVDRFYGREEELASILQALEKNPVVVATGITGIGKSTLGAKVCEALRGRQSLFWRTIRPWDTTTDLAGRVGGFLRSHGRLDLGGLLIGPGPKDSARIEDALAADLRGLPALFVLDDAQNASADAQDFLQILLRLVGRANGPSVLLLSRVVPDIYTRRDVAIESSIVEIALSGLDRTSATRLLADAGIRDPIIGSLTDACGGVPLFLKLLASAGPKAAASTGWRTLETYIAEQIEPSLDLAERSALEVASFYDIAVPASGLLLEEDVRGRTLIGLRRKGLLSPVGSDLFAVHEAIRTFVRDGLSTARKETLVAHIVPWLLQGSQTALERGDAHAAISYLANAVAIETYPARRRSNLEQLGDLRRQVGDVPGAMDSYRMVLKGVSEGSERAILRRKVALCLEMMGHMQEAEDEIDAGWQEIPQEPSLAGGWLAYQKASIAFTRGDYDTALEEVERVLGWMPALSPDPELWGWIANMRGLVYLYDLKREDPSLARADFLAAAAALEEAKQLRGLCMAYNNLFLAAAALGDQERALPELDRSASLARSIGDLPALGTALFTKAWFLTEQLGDYDAAEALYNETYQLAKETHQRDKLIWHYYHFAVLYLRTGRFEQARESMEYFLGASGFLVNPERRIEDLGFMARLCLLANDAPWAADYLS
ncbi:MAG: tetratricopeptide repeat protein, partial [Thermoplasmata archaeon]